MTEHHGHTATSSKRTREDSSPTPSAGKKKHKPKASSPTYRELLKPGMLAYAYVDGSTPDQARLFSLSIKYCDSTYKSAISLQTTLHLQGFEDKMAIALFIHSRDIIPYQSSLKSPSITLSHDLLGEIARDKNNPTLTMLSLPLKKTPTIQCPQLPKSEGLLLPKLSNDDGSFKSVVDICCSTQIHIIFDYAWVHRKQRPNLDLVMRAFGEVGHDNDVTHRIPRGYHETDWTIFGPQFEDESIKHGSSEGDYRRFGVPPSYFTSASPPHIPPPDHSSITKTPPPLQNNPKEKGKQKEKEKEKHITYTYSPTEIATSPPPFTASPPLKPNFPLTRSELKDLLQEVLPSVVGTREKNAIDRSELKEVVKEVLGEVVEGLLPGALKTVLPGVVEEMFVKREAQDRRDGSEGLDASVETSSSLSDSPSHPPSTTPPNLITLINKKVIRLVSKQIESTLDSIETTRQAADDEFFDTWQERKYELELIAEDGCAAIEAKGIERLEEFKNEVELGADEELVAVEERAGVVDGVVGRLEGRMGRLEQRVEGVRRVRARSI